MRRRSRGSDEPRAAGSSQRAATLPPPTIEDKRRAQRARTLGGQQLATVQATAERWRNGLAGLTAVLSAAAFVKAPDLGNDLSLAWRIAVAVPTIAGLLLLLYGTWQAMRAAFGLPTQIWLTGEGLRMWEVHQARLSLAFLERARGGFLLGVLLVIAAVGVAFLSPSGSASPLVRVETAVGNYCGHLDGVPGPALAVTGEDGTVHRFATGELRSLQAVSRC
jgi:hypothetical protein